MKAIETRYAGCRFRSRLEARWAVFFDHLGIEWEYEPQGFEKDGVRYLPDFWLPRSQTWVEVKGSQEQLEADQERIGDILDWGSPLPGINGSYGDPSRGLLVLGPIPRPSVGLPLFLLIQHHKGLWLNRAYLTEVGPVAIGCWSGWEPPPADVGTDGTLTGCIPKTEHHMAGLAPLYVAKDRQHPHLDRVNDALEAARSARFEHGQVGVR